MLAGMFAVLGEKEWVARLLPIAFSLVSVVLLWALMKDCAGRRNFSTHEWTQQTEGPRIIHRSVASSGLASRLQRKSSRPFLRVRVRRLVSEASRFASGNRTVEGSREIKMCQKKAVY
jgi:hypothetical protein